MPVPARPASALESTRSDATGSTLPDRQWRPPRRIPSIKDPRPVTPCLDVISKPAGAASRHACDGYRCRFGRWSKQRQAFHELVLGGCGKAGGTGHLSPRTPSLVRPRGSASSCCEYRDVEGWPGHPVLCSAAAEFDPPLLVHGSDTGKWCAPSTSTWQVPVVTPPLPF